MTWATACPATSLWTAVTSAALITVAPGRSAQPLASIGRRPSRNQAMSGSPDGLASHAIRVGSLGAAAAGLACSFGGCSFGGGAGGAAGGSTRAGTNTTGSACAGITSGRAAAGWERKSEATHCWATMAPQPTTTATPARRRQRLPRWRPRVSARARSGRRARVRPRP